MKRLTSLSAIGALAFSQLTIAAITVSPSGYSTISSGDVTINAQSAPHDTLFIIEGEPGDFIGDIVVNTPTNPQNPHRVRLTIRNKGTSANGFDTTIGVDGVENILFTGDGELWLENVFIRGELGSLSGQGFPTGDVIVNVISGTIRVRRNILADITAIGTFDFTPPLGRVINAIVLPEDPPPPNSRCLGCDQNDNSIHGSIRAYNGGIGSIDVYNGLGTIDQEIVSEGPVDSIEAGRINGIDIVMTGYDLGSLAANLGGWGGDTTADDDGNPVGISVPGSIEASKITNFQVHKDMQAHLKVAFGPPAGTVWKIGGSLTSGALLEFLQDDQLKHQIVVGEQVMGGEWESGAEVKVGNSPVYTLEEGYLTLPDVFGDGAVGAAPYQMHTKATHPAPFAVTTIGYLDLSSFEIPPPCINDFYVSIEYYGRVAVTGTATTAVVVWEGPKNWDGVDPANPNYTIVQKTVSAGAGGRTVTLTPHGGWTWSVDKTYRIEIQEDRIKNLDLINSGGGSPTYSPADAYWFKTADGCREMFDLSGNNYLGGEDMGVWFIEPVDFNEDEVADDADRDILLRGIDEHGGSDE